MKRKRIFINAFIITVFIISILGTFYKVEILRNIIYSLILPIFLIILIEFIIEIRDMSEKDAKKSQENYEKLANMGKEIQN